MGYLVVLVVDDPNQCNDVIHAWEDLGAKGITILESTGIGRIRRAGIRDDIPLMPSVSDLLSSAETRHRTIFSVVDTIEDTEAFIQATESIIGDLDQPNSGVLFVVDLVKVRGINKDR